MCSTDSGISESLQAALDTWAASHDCSCVDIESDTRFKRLWIICISAASFVCLVITLIIMWTERKKKNTSVEEDEEEGKQTSTSTGKRSSQTNKQSAAELQRELEEEEDDDDLKPNLEKAMQHLLRTSPTKNGKWRPIWSTGVADISEIGGIGTELYFRLLKRLGICFLYMAAFTTLAVGFGVVSDFAPDNGQYLAKTTVGNFGSSVTGNNLLPPDQRYLVLESPSGCEGIAVTDITKIIAWLDVVAMVIFISVLAWFRFNTIPKIVKEADADDITVKDFGVEIDKLPLTIDGMEEEDPDRPGFNKYEAKLCELLEERMTLMRKSRPDPRLEATGPPKVQEIVLVRDYNGRLEKKGKQAQLTKDIKIAEYVGDTKTKEKKEKALEKLNVTLQKKLKPVPELNVVRAYAIVNTQEDADNLMIDYRFSTYALLRWMQQCIGNIKFLECCCPQRHRFFQGHAIRVREPPEPTNIIWRNQDVPYKWRLLRRAIIMIIFLLIVILSFVLVYAASAGAKSNMQSNNQLLGDSSCDPDTTAIGTSAYQCYVENATAWTMNYIETEASADEVGCWCGTIGYQAILNDPSLITGVCADWLTNIGTGIAISVGATLIVVVINILCKGTLLRLAEEEKPLSESDLNASKMTKIWALQTLNTGFVIFAVNFSPPDGMPFGFIFLGEYSDAVRGWYAVVGAALLMNMLANSVTPGGTSIVGMLMGWCCRRRGGPKAKHQAELLKLYENPDFDIAAKFAQLLTTVFVTMTYSAGLPLLNVFAAMYMFFTFWCDKLELLWGSKRPPAISFSMASDAVQYMLYSIALHLVFAIWMFGQPCTFPSSPLGGQLASLSDSAIDSASSSSGSSATAASLQNRFEERLTRESTWMIFVLLVICILLWVIWTVLWILGGTVGTACEVLKSCLCPKRHKVAPEADAAAADSAGPIQTWETCRHTIERVCPPASYKMEEHPSFSHIKDILAATLANSHSTSNPLFSPRGPPVPKDLAEKFLVACKREYIDKVDQAVGKCFEESKASPEDQEALSKFESIVRSASSAESAKQAIEEIAAKWKMAPPGP
mmetsp:Transcript_19394/g.41654  ORF Transcript_19394/g.41654 Transcript_19394/m.41654 type:complete len:1063 (+) Transcript_19394:126-3314(+)